MSDTILSSDCIIFPKEYYICKTWDMFWKLVPAVPIVLMGIAILPGTRNIVFDGEQFNGITLKTSFGGVEISNN